MNVLIVDDHTMLRAGLRLLLEREGITVVGEAANGRDAVAAARRLKPDIVLMDISMPEMNGVDATRRVLGDVPGAKVVALSMHTDRRYVIAMFTAGASGYLLKGAASDELAQALRAVSQGMTYVSPAVGGVVVGELLDHSRGEGDPKPRSLTAREREVLQLLAEGKSSKDIAKILHVAVATVETHRRQIMEKLDLHTIAELTKYAVREGLTALE